MAGAIQSVVAAPVDALQIRFRSTDVLGGKYTSMWQYGRKKLVEIGISGAFAGWRLSLLKDSLGCAAFFATFEYVKAQSYYSFVAKYYGGLTPYQRTLRPGTGFEDSIRVIKPHYAIEPSFLMLAGITASIAQQIVQHPLTLIQAIHYQSISGDPKSPSSLKDRKGYEKTYQRCLVYVRRFGGWRKWLYRGFFLNTVKQVPSTSAGLVIFELARRRYANEAEAVKIVKDGYDILLR